MATDPNKPWLTEGFSLDYNPFSSNRVMRTGLGQSDFYQDPETGQWFKRETVSGMGDNQYWDQWVPYEGDPANETYTATSGDTDYQQGYTPGWEFGVNFDTVRQNNPEFADNWGRSAGGGFLRDSVGYDQFKVIDYDPETGAYVTMSKTGDKEGTLQLWMPDESGGMRVVKNLGTQPWDSNLNVTEQGAFKAGSIALGAAASYYAPLMWGGQAGTLGSTIGKALWDGFSAIAPETAQAISNGWNALSTAAQKAFGSIENWAASFNPDFQGFVNSDAGASIVSSGGSGSFENPLGDWPTADIGFENPLGDWPTGGAGTPTPGVPTPTLDPNVQTMPPIEINPPPPTAPVAIPPVVTPPVNVTTPNPGSPDYSSDDMPNEAQDPANDNPDTPDEPPYQPPQPPATNNYSKLVNDIANATGLTPGQVALILGATPALAGLISGNDGETTTSTQGSPEQQQARNDIATAVSARLPEYMQRDRQRADQQMSWANQVVNVPSQYPLPQSVFGQQGMAGGYQPPPVVGMMQPPQQQNPWGLMGPPKLF